MTSLDAAITDLRDTITKDGFTPEGLCEIAEDWGVHPQLLRRKFTEKLGTAPEDYTAPEKVEIDYAARYEAGMKRAWRAHPYMTWASLTEKQRASAIALINRNLATPDLSIVWK